MNAAALILLLLVLLCIAILYGCYVAFDRLQTRAEHHRGRQRWTAIAGAAVVALVALTTFWACFAFSAGLMQAVGLNLR